ncbi:cytochrome P450 family protein [Pleurotus pulmonarius]
MADLVCTLSPPCGVLSSAPFHSMDVGNLVEIVIIICRSMLVVLRYSPSIRRLVRRLPIPTAIDMSKTLGLKPWEACALPGKEKSPTDNSLISIPGPGHLRVVINDVDSAFELLEKPNFSDRPQWPMARLLGRDQNVGFLQYGKRLQQSRRILAGSFNRGVVTKHWKGLIESHSTELVRCLLSSPEDFFEDVQTEVKRMIIELTYGDMPNREYISRVNKVQHEISAVIQPTRIWLVNIIPERLVWLLPSSINRFLRWTREMRIIYQQLIQSSFDRAKVQARPSFVTSCLVSNPTVPEDVVLSAAGSLLSAGTETMEAFILTFIALLHDRPDIQERAFSEISSVVGLGRLPGLQDYDALPYINCIIQEVHRYHPVVPLVTHSNRSEENCIGWRIPKKSWVFANVWAMLHDGRIYSKPNEFSPDRFMPRHGESTLRDPRDLVFGFGRRVCPGRHLANSFLFLVVTRVVALLKIVPRDNQAPIEWQNALVSAPHGFQCGFEAREHVTISSFV